jgi:hypothetical protein
MLDINVGAAPLPKDETSWSSCGDTRRIAENGRLPCGRRTRHGGRRDYVFRCTSVAGLGNGSLHDPYRPPSGPTVDPPPRREEYSNYGPTADTGGLSKTTPTIYAYLSWDALFEGESAVGKKDALPGPGQKPVTERPGRERVIRAAYLQGSAPSIQIFKLVAASRLRSNFYCADANK